MTATAPDSDDTARTRKSDVGGGLAVSWFLQCWMDGINGTALTTVQYSADKKEALIVGAVPETEIVSMSIPSCSGTKQRSEVSVGMDLRACITPRDPRLYIRVIRYQQGGSMHIVHPPST